MHVVISHPQIHPLTPANREKLRRLLGGGRKPKLTPQTGKTQRRLAATGLCWSPGSPGSFRCRSSRSSIVQHLRAGRSGVPGGSPSEEREVARSRRGCSRGVPVVRVRVFPGEGPEEQSCSAGIPGVLHIWVDPWMDLAGRAGKDCPVEAIHLKKESEIQAVISMGQNFSSWSTLPENGGIWPKESKCSV